MVKIDLITGFLGSGKTTFIREYARYLIGKGEKICIIENDYGAVNIDMVLLQDLLGENCNLEMIVGGDGKEAHRRRFRTKLISMGMSGFDRVIIEPSGIYDVDEFFDVLYDEPLDRWYEISGVISLVDAQSISGFGEVERYIFMSEIASAGKLIITKLSDYSKAGAVKAAVNDIMMEYGGKTFDVGKDFIAKPLAEFDADTFEELRTCGYRHASYVKLPVEEGQFTPLFYFDVEMPEDILQALVKDLFAKDDVGRVIRVKGFVKTDGERQVEINATGQKINLSPATSSRNALIIIGEKLNKSYINDVLKDYCSVVSL